VLAAALGTVAWLADRTAYAWHRGEWLMATNLLERCSRPGFCKALDSTRELRERKNKTSRPRQGQARDLGVWSTLVPVAAARSERGRAGVESDGALGSTCKSEAVCTCWDRDVVRIYS
jgi:hypothetical protein